MATLRVPMTINGVSYAAGDTPTSEHADLIRNPDAWTGGTVPALSRRGGVFSVASFPLAVPDNATDSTAAVKAAVEMARAYGGMVEFPGKYVVSDTITMYDGMTWRGLGPGVSGLRMANGVNKDLVKTDQFDTLNPGSTTGGPKNWSIKGMTLDGNGANQTSGWTASFYGSNYVMDNVHFLNGKSGNVRSRWGAGGTNMEAHWTNVKIIDHRGGAGLDWQGPHDSVFTNMHVFIDGSVTPAVGLHGIVTSGNAGAEQFVNTHVWGSHDIGWYLQRSIRAASIVAEGARTNLLLDTHDCVIAGVDIFGTNGAGPWTGTETGLQMGTSGGTVRRGNTVLGRTWWWAAGDKPTNFFADDGNTVHLECRTNSATAALFGTPTYAKGSYRIVCTDNTQHTVGRNVLTGTGVPSNAMGVNGQLYVREDGVGGTTLYHRRTGAWVAIV